MGHLSIVYGCIQGPAFRKNGDEMNRHNLATIDALPATDRHDTMPVLTRDMFNTPSDTPGYNVVVTTFGASSNHVETSWPAWLAKFERLLQNLYWEEVDVHLITELVGTHHFHWGLVQNQPSDDDEDVFDADVSMELELSGPDQWVFSGGPRDFYEELLPYQPQRSCNPGEPKRVERAE